MLRIIGLLTALVVIVATLSVGTFAYFNDVTSVTNNTITAGTLTLTVGGGSPVAISVSDVYPGANGTAASWSISGSGSINGTLAIDISAITNLENTRSALETASGDTTSANTSGELGGRLRMAIWLDANSNGVLNTGEKYLSANTSAVTSWSGTDGTAPTYAAAPSIFFTVDSFDSDSYANVKTNFTGAAGNARVEYHFPNSATQTNPPYYDDNQAQSDGVAFNITFSFVQSQ